MEGERPAVMVLVMSLLVAIFLTQTARCEENRCGREKRERGRSLRHLTEYVEELEGVEVEGDPLGVPRSSSYTTATPDDESAKEQIVMNRIREAFLSYRDRQSMESRRMEEDEARRETLRRLGYPDPPADLEGTRNPPISNLKGVTERRTAQTREDPHILNLIERHEGQRRREREKRSRSIDSVNVNKIIQFAQSATEAGFGQRNGDACFFERPADTDNNHVTSAAFYVYILGCKRRRVKPNSVLVYRIAPSAIYQMDSEADEDRELLATKTLAASHVSAWHRFDVTTMVQNWMSDVGSADAEWLVLTVEFSDFDHEVIYPMNTGDQDHLPYLEMNVAPRLVHRRRRSIPSPDSEMDDDGDYPSDGRPSTAEEECSETTVECCRRSMNVDFHAIGLRWIISPQSFQLSYCDGPCSTVPTDVRLLTPGLAAAIADRKTSGLCCAPVEYADLDVVYYDDKMHVIFGTLRNFNVVRCGCL